MDFCGFNGIIYTEVFLGKPWRCRAPALRAAVPFDHVSKMPLQASIFACAIIYTESLAHDI